MKNLINDFILVLFRNLINSVDEFSSNEIIFIIYCVQKKIDLPKIQFKQLGEISD